MFDIRQKPFAFQHAVRGPAVQRGPKYRRRGFVHRRLLTLSPQVKALCSYCGTWYQKDSKSLLDKPCSYCTMKSYIHIIPDALRPWQLHDPQENGYCEGHSQFNCGRCNMFFYSWSVMGCMCPPQNVESKLVLKDERHRVLSTCRFCCYLHYPWLYDPTVSRTGPKVAPPAKTKSAIEKKIELEFGLNHVLLEGELNVLNARPFWAAAPQPAEQPHRAHNRVVALQNAAAATRREERAAARAERDAIRNARRVGAAAAAPPDVAELIERERQRIEQIMREVGYGYEDDEDR